MGSSWSVAAGQLATAGFTAAPSAYNSLSAMSTSPVNPFSQSSFLGYGSATSVGLGTQG
jgi:hypothetical protein